MFDDEVKKVLMDLKDDDNELPFKFREKKSTEQNELVATFLDAYVKSNGAEVSPTVAGEFLIKEKWSHVYKK